MQQELYAHLLPTLGERILPALFRRLEAVAHQTDDVFLFSYVIEGITSFDTPDVSERAIVLLRHDAPLVQRAGVRVLARRPTAAALDALWDVHCAIRVDRDPFLRNQEPKTSAYTDSFAALRACVRLNTQWLLDNIRASGPDFKPVHDLAYLIANLEDGADIWHACKPLLLTSVQREHERCIAVNIRRYVDRDEIDWLRKRIPREDNLIGASALRALARVDPDIALEELPRLPSMQFGMTRSWWFDDLLESRPNELQSFVVDELQKAETPTHIATVVQDRADRISPAMVSSLLDTLARVIHSELSGSVPSNQHPGYVLCGVLAQCNRLEQIACFEKQRSGQLTDKLTTWLLRIGPRRGRGNIPEIPHALKILARIGGEAFTKVINAYLTADNKFGRLDGLLQAARRPDDRTREHLKRISQQDELWDENAIEQSYAAEALYAVGEYEALIRYFIRWGSDTSPRLTRRLPDGAVGADLIKECCEILKRDDPAPGAIIAVGMIGRWKQTSRIRDILRDAPLDSEIAAACIIALRLLKDGSDEAVESVSPHLACSDNRHAVDTLLAIESDKAHDALLSRLGQAFNQSIAVHLLNQPRTCESAAVIIREHFKTLDAEKKAGLMAAIIALVNDVNKLSLVLEGVSAHDFLLDAAFAREGEFWFVCSKAQVIASLASFDATAAFEAAQATLQNPQSHDREQYPYVLVQIHPGNAVPVLLEQACVEQVEGVIWAIGRALDGLPTSESERLGKTLSDWVTGQDRVRRKVACQILGHRNDYTEKTLDLLQQYLNDSDDGVGAAAREAIILQRKKHEVWRILRAITKERDESRRWVLLDAAIALGDPGDCYQETPEWARQLSMTLRSPFMKWYFKEQMVNRREALARKGGVYIASRTNSSDGMGNEFDTECIPDD